MMTWYRSLFRRAVFLVSAWASLSAPSILAVASDVARDDSAAAERFWPSWRGPWSTGVAPHADPPVQWSEAENVRWKIELPGVGHSTPVVWGDRLFLTAAVPFGDPI